MVDIRDLKIKRYNSINFTHHLNIIPWELISSTINLTTQFTSSRLPHHAGHAQPKTFRNLPLSEKELPEVQ
jgi:hypothetical protein